MDSVTHTVIGICLGEVIAGKQIEKKALVIAALANNLPDIDVVTSLWTDPVNELLVHRGITHSILFTLIASPLFALAFQKIIKNNEMSFKRWLVLIGSGLLLHIIMDAFTTYGTGWFEPFSHERVSFNTLFILDPFFSIALLLSSIALFLVRRNSLRLRKQIALVGLSISLLYLIVTIIIKLYVNSVVEKDLATKKMPHHDYMATPTGLNNILWYSIVKSDNNFYVGYYSIFDKNPAISWEFFEKKDSLLGAMETSEEVKLLRRFSKNYYCIRKQDSGVTFSDMRFGQISGWQFPQADFVFNFNLELKQNNKLNLQQGRFKSFNSDDFNLLVKRIKGIEN